MQNVKRTAVLLTVLSVGVVSCGGTEDFISVGELQESTETAEERAEESWAIFETFYDKPMPESGWDTNSDGEVDAWHQESRNHNVWFYDTDLDGVVDHMQAARQGSGHLETFYWAGTPSVFGYDTDQNSEADIFGLLKEDGSYEHLSSWVEVRDFINSTSVISD